MELSSRELTSESLSENANVCFWRSKDDNGEAGPRLYPEVGARSGESDVVRTSLLRERVTYAGSRVDDDCGAYEGEDRGSDDVDCLGLRGLSVGLNKERSFPPLLFFLSGFVILGLDGLRPGEKSDDDDAAFGLGGDGERGKRDEAKREEVLALGASGGEDGGLVRHSEDCCDCLPCRYVVVFGSTGYRSVSESDVGSKKSDGS